MEPLVGKQLLAECTGDPQATVLPRKTIDLPITFLIDFYNLVILQKVGLLNSYDEEIKTVT